MDLPALSAKYTYYFLYFVPRPVMTNDPKLPGLPQQQSIFSQFQGSEVWNQLSAEPQAPWFLPKAPWFLPKAPWKVGVFQLQVLMFLVLSPYQPTLCLHLLAFSSSVCLALEAFSLIRIHVITLRKSRINSYCQDPEWNHVLFTLNHIK